MKDHLKDFCKEHNIRIEYTNNKPIVLATKVKGDIPIIQANRLFENCPKLVSYAIFNYYYEKEDKQYNLKIIKEYIHSKVKQQHYKIIPANEQFLRAIKNHQNFVQKPISKMSKRDPFELGIAHITKKNFHGKISHIKPNQSFKVNESQEINLEIEVLENNNYFD